MASSSKETFKVPMKDKSDEPRKPVPRVDGGVGSDNESSGADSEGSRGSRGSRGGKKSSEQPDHVLCGWYMKNGRTCRNQIVRGTSPVCREHEADALATVPAYISIMEVARAKLLDTRTGKFKTPDAEHGMAEVLDEYRRALDCSYHRTEGYGVAGGAYTYAGIGLFDTAYSVLGGMTFDSADMRVYKELVSHRARNLDRRIAELKVQIATLEALKTSYIPIPALNALMHEAQQFEPPMRVSKEDEEMIDRADSD